MTEKKPLRVWLMSDLHTETTPYELPKPIPDFDVAVVAGDVAEGLGAAMAWLQMHLVPLGRPVIYVMGNHCFYGGDLHVEEQALQAGKDAGVHVLHSGQSVIIDGVRFVGAVLWTDYAISGDVLAAMNWARTGMPDMRGIDVGLRRIWTKDLAAEHQRHLAGIVAVLEQPHDGPTVVVTHHAPHERSLRDFYASEPSDGSFASDLSWVMQDFAPEFWFHGHTHAYRYYEVGETQVVCNPRGYVQHHEDMSYAESDRFDPALVIEVG